MRGSSHDVQLQNFVCFLFTCLLFCFFQHPLPGVPNNIKTAVLFVCQTSGPLEQRTEQEIFYSCPSLSAEAFFEAVSRQLAGLEEESSPYAGKLESQLEQTVEVAQAVQASLCNCFSLDASLLQYIAFRPS